MSDESAKPRKPRGHRIVAFRLEEDAFQALRERAPETKGRAGGISLYVRSLVYEHLGMKMPTQYGDMGRSSRKRPPRKNP